VRRTVSAPGTVKRKAGDSAGQGCELGASLRRKVQFAGHGEWQAGKCAMQDSAEGRKVCTAVLCATQGIAQKEKVNVLGIAVRREQQSPT
jgi:hypothetical protein